MIRDAAMIYDRSQELSTVPLCRRRKSGSERMHISGSKDIYRVSQQRAEELHPPDGMGSRGDEAREKEQHAKQAVADDAHDDVIVAVAPDRAEHRERLACSLAQLNYYGVHRRTPDIV
jgi:hypothetical protein